MIVLITPTGGRPSQINLCYYFMQRQTYPGQVTWIIIDDCQPRTTDEIQSRENWTVVKAYPEPSWQPGENTQARNISVGINYILANYKKEDIEAIFIIEDDDYYRPIYLERMVVRLKGFDITGETNTIYYNVYYRTAVTNPNNIHASLFQTAFTMEAIPHVESSYADKFIDCRLWEKVQNKNLFREGNLAVGIKGMPGRYGIGAGHTRWSSNIDRNLDYLSSLIGKEDAKLYERYYGDNGMQQHPLFATRRV
jgi:hypothetical protein